MAAGACLTGAAGTFTFPVSHKQTLLFPGESQAMQVVDPPRPRFGFPSEWLTAAVFLIGTVLVGLLIVRELRVTPAAATPEPAVSSVPAVPPDAAARSQ